MELRPYQGDLIEKSRLSMSKGNRKTLIVAPCGAGKTVLASFMAGNHVQRGGEVLFLAHRRELLEQTEDTFRRAGINMQGITIMSVQTAARRLEKIPAPTMIICDECHHCMAGQWRKVVDYFPKAWIIGLTATPCRLDGKGLGDVFDQMVSGITTADLIRDGWLAPYRYIAPPTSVDLSGIRTVRGDYDKRMVAKAVDKPQIVGDAVQHYIKYAAGKQAIVYCASIEHSEHIAQAFSAAGIKAYHIDGKTPKYQRDWIIARFRERKIMVLSNVDLLGEGFDVPACDACIMLRPTQSTALYIQQSMRCMRPSPGKTAIILDHVGNCARHGLPDDEREWTLKERIKKKRASHDDEKIIVCKECFAVFSPPPFVCPSCGAKPEQAERSEVEQVDGNLVELTPEMRDQMRKQKRAEEANCKSFDDFMKLAIARGYKSGWAYHRARERGYV